ncbi:MAG: O-antigen ligase family protein, partial [Elusimicrobia bacterium]|nr:O-antigen ligase family protein [Elusimicrobiota bacterium]
APRRWTPERKRRLAQAAAAAAAVFAVLLCYKFLHRVDADGHAIPAGRSLARLLFWATALKMLAARPLAGVGLGGYASAYVSYKVGHGQNSLFAHSLPFQLLAETGLAGFLAFFSFAALWLRRAAHGPGDPPARWPYALGGAMMLVYALLSVGLEYLANLLLLWLFLGAAAPEATLWKPRRSVVLVLCAAALAASPYVFCPFSASRDVVAGRERLAAGDPAGAAESFSAAARTFPLSWEAQEGWARALFARWLAGHAAADLQGALEHQARAIALDSRDGGLWQGLARYRLAAGDEAGAARAEETAAALRPNRVLY